jgi:carboxylesterase
MAVSKVCLLLHGFTGGPYEVQPLAEALKADGYHTIVPTLTGHQVSLGLHSVSYTDWLDDVHRYMGEALELAESVDLVGFSMGGLLAAYAANRYRVRRLVLLSAAVIYVSPGRFTRSMVEMLRHKDYSHFNRAAGTSLRAAWQFTRLAKLLRSEFTRLKVPTLIVQGEQDHIVHPLSARWIYSRVNAPKEMLMFPNSKHMVCQDTEAEQIIRSVRQFLKRS